MCSFNHRLQNLKVIGTNQDVAIYNGFSMDNPELKLLLCVYHLEKSDRHKLSQLHPKKGAANKILVDIYGYQYGSVKELGLADSTTIEDFDSNLANLKEPWEQLCSGFYEWFVVKRKTLFQERVIEEARKGSNVHGLYFNNNIESMHFKEKTEQCHKLGSSIDVINTLKEIIDRQHDDKVRPIYGSDPYKLSREYDRFLIDNLKWHSMTSEERKKHVLAFRNYNSCLEDQFTKPAKSGRKRSHQTRKRKPEPDVFINRLENKEKRSEKKVQIEDPNAKRTVTYELFLRSLVPRQVERCQSNCGNKLKSSDNGDYLLVKSHGPSSYSVKGESRAKYGPQYIHFKNDCLKEYAHLKHDVKYEKFPLSIITIDKLTSELLSEEDKNNLIEYGLRFP